MLPTSEPMTFFYAHIYIYTHSTVKINVVLHLKMIWCQAPNGADGTKGEKIDGRREGEKK